MISKCGYFIMIYDIYKKTTMERAQVISQTISTFNALQNQSSVLFSEANILNHAEIMIEEFFESGYNPFIRNLQSSIAGIPLNDYTVIALDSWLKTLTIQLERIKEGPSRTDYAEVVYIHQKYIPKLFDTLTDIKLELLEQLFTPEESPQDANSKKLGLSTETVLTPSSAAFLIAQLYNFGVIRQDVTPSVISQLLGPVLGCDANEMESAINFEKGSYRYIAQTNSEELIVLSKILRSITARVENQMKVDK